MVLLLGAFVQQLAQENEQNRAVSPGRLKLSSTRLVHSNQKTGTSLAAVVPAHLHMQLQLQLHYSYIYYPYDGRSCSTYLLHTVFPTIHIVSKHNKITRALGGWRGGGWRDQVTASVLAGGGLCADIAEAQPTPEGIQAWPATVTGSFRPL